MMAVARIPTPTERRLADRDHAILALVCDQVRPADLSPRREVELIQAGADRVRRVLDQLETAVISAAALERQERGCDEHVRGSCERCHWRQIQPCRGFKSLRRRLDFAHHAYRRAMRRLGGNY